MNLSKMIPVLVLALAGMATACGNKCKSTCEDAKDCAGADKSTDCDKECDDADKNADTQGCSDQYDDVVSCISDLDDICKFDPTKDCLSQETALGACSQKYCTAHASDASCKAP